MLNFSTPDKTANTGQDTNTGGTTTGKSGTPSGNLDALKDLLKDMSVEPNRIDAQIYKLSVLRFLESERESLDLSDSNPVDSHYHRVQVTVSLTAWTVDPAVAALVYLDFYPYSGDWWCHKIVTKTKEEKNSARALNDEELKNRLQNRVAVANDELARTFSGSALLSMEDLLRWFDLSKTPSDPYTGCHGWLMEKYLLPKLVHVEPLGDSRYVMINQGAETSHDIGLELNAGRYGKVDTGQKANDAELAKQAHIRLTAISFAAGERRAGWFFRGDSQSSSMRPLERRLRMVIDIPVNLKKLELHVHKLFLDKNNKNLAKFPEQTRGLHSSRWLLDEIEDDVEGKLGHDRCDTAIQEKRISRQEHCYPSETYWQLTKSRVRNLISLGWSERLVIDVPETVPAERKLKYAIHANLVSPDLREGSLNQFLIIDGNRIKELVQEKSGLPDGYLRIEDFDGDYVYPGFIDTHNHPHYNFIPQWVPSHPEGITDTCNPFCNRYQWQKENIYQASIIKAYEKLDTLGYGIDGLRYGHLRALVGGATTIQGGDDPGQPPTQLRTLWKHAASSTKKVSTLRDIGQLKEYKEALDAKRIRRLFLHVAEGTDAESKDELSILEQAGLLRPEVVLIHAIPFGAVELKKLKERQVPVVWSPRSNLVLYGKTMDIKTVVEHQIPVALAPDWSITGSSNMLQELRCARDYADTNGLDGITNEQLYRMITETAAQIAGLEHDGHLLGGKLAPNTYADFIVIKKKKDNPFDNLLAVTEEDIRLVVIGGQPVLGEPKLFNLISSDLPIDYIDVGNSVKAVRLVPIREGAASSPRSISTMQDHLAQAWPLAPVRESPSNSCKVPITSH